MAAGSRKKDKVPYPGSKGESTTAFYTKKKWKALLQETRLDVAGRFLGPRGGLVVTSALFKNTYIVALDLSHNALGDEGAMTIANLLRVNTTLQHLNLAHNDISDVGGIAIASAFIPNVSATGQPGQWNRTLYTLILMGNALADDTLLALSNAAACNRDLTRIDLSWNKVGPNGTRCLTRAFQRNPLCVYQLAANALGDEGTTHLCEALQRHGGRSQLSLNLYNNEISYSGANAVGQLLAQTSVVQDVSLAGNTIGFKGAQALQQHLTDFAVLAACPLRFLNLSDNWLGDEGAASVAAIIAADLPALERLDVSDNQITDPGATTIVMAVLRNTHLRILNCENNRLGAKAVEAVVQLVHESSSLKSLNVSHCIESAEHRRTLTVAVGETEGLHVELGPNPDTAVAAAGDEPSDLVSKMTEHLQMLADQDAQRERDNPPAKKKGKKAKGQ
jgi:Ran GTPase-activating protein (RanGAP) involved in mRNA processing and transport